MKNILLSILFIASSLSLSAQDRTISESVKKQVFARDGGKCQCCGSTENLEYDHIIPFSKGGGNKVCNIQLLCRTCNRSKSDNSHCAEHYKRLDTGSCDTYKEAPTQPKPQVKTRTYKSNSSAYRSTSTQCTAYTKKGARCRNMTRNPSGRCHVHD